MPYPDVVETTRPPLVKFTELLALLFSRRMAWFDPLVIVLDVPAKVTLALLARFKISIAGPPLPAELSMFRAPLTATVPETPLRRMPWPLLVGALTLFSVRFSVVLEMSRAAAP